ncbi:peptide deformylase [Ruicaihuangia caeni]|uniref:peptide deformylase n=1 Tax=Ruicaihuangia caeni TaxID=3042517 RepID=UPI00338D460E
MAVLPIVITGNPVLHTPAKPVERFDDELRRLVDDMFETMDEAPGVGLAAPQVGVGLRVFVYGWEDEDGYLWRGVAINPELWQSPLDLGPADEDEESEGCLSIPGERFPLRRAERVILRAVDLDQEPFEIVAEGWLARIFQHEYDHLDGVLYADRLGHVYAKAIQKAIKKSGWGKPGDSWMPGVDHLEGEHPARG